MNWAKLSSSSTLRKLWIAGCVAAAGVLAVPLALATHQFADVETGSPHHADISAINTAGITAGCAPGLYCPADFVRRDQMATFLRRGLGRAVISGGSGGTLTSTFETIVTSNIPTGGAPGGTGAVIAFAELNVLADAGTLAGPAVVEFSIVPDGGGVGTPTVITLHPAAVTSAVSASRSFRFMVDTGTTETFHLEARLADALAADADDVKVNVAFLTLLYEPFTG